jgi:hypothetical protein
MMRAPNAGALGQALARAMDEARERVAPGGLSKEKERVIF